MNNQNIAEQQQVNLQKNNLTNPQNTNNLGVQSLKQGESNVAQSGLNVAQQHENGQQAQKSLLADNGQQAAELTQRIDKTEQCGSQNSSESVEPTSNKIVSKKRAGVTNKSKNNIVSVLKTMQVSSVKNISEQSLRINGKAISEMLDESAAKKREPEKRLSSYDECLTEFKQLIIQLISYKLNEHQISTYFANHINIGGKGGKVVNLKLDVPARQIRMFIKRHNLDKTVQTKSVD